MSNRRLRGVAVYRPILYGSTSTPLSAADKLAAPPDHTHRWTVSVRSAASHPLPSISAITGQPANASTVQASEATGPTASAELSGASATTAVASGSGATISTRGRDQEHDYHKMVGGKDDISHFIKRVQFKLHDTYPQATRNIDKPPFSVTETGWGEFEIQIKIFFVPEANEKPITLFHHLKLHPWLATASAVERPATAPNPIAVDETTANTDGAEAVPVDNAEQPADTLVPTETDRMDLVEPPTTLTEDTKVSSATDELFGDAVPAEAPSAPMTGAVVTDALAPTPVLPPVVHSWQYDEIVFPEPVESFYEILTAHPPTPLPSSSAQAFLDPSAYRSYQLATQTQSDDALPSDSARPVPPHPLHTPTGYLFDALSLEAQQAEADRLEMARIAAVREIERGREQLIKAERALKEARIKISSFSKQDGVPPVVLNTSEAVQPAK